MAIGDKLGYKNVANTSALVKSGPAGLFGIVPTVTGNITIYDNTTNSGTVLYTGTGVTVGVPIHFGGNGIAAMNGIYVVATATCNVMYT